MINWGNSSQCATQCFGVENGGKVESVLCISTSRWVKQKCTMLIQSTIPWCNSSTDQRGVEIFRSTLCLPSIMSYWSSLSEQLFRHVLSLRYSSGMGCISCLYTLTQTLDIKEDREDIRFNVIQTNSKSFFFSVMSGAASTRSLQKYVNIFFSKCQIFNPAPPISDMTVEVWCQVYKINGSILCLTDFYIFWVKFCQRKVLIQWSCKRQTMRQ